MAGLPELRESMTLEALMAELAAKECICPVPQRWNSLHGLLAARASSASGRPPVPLILAGWNFSTDEDKLERLMEQLRWAKANDVFPEAVRFLAGLSAPDWYTGN